MTNFDPANSKPAYANFGKSTVAQLPTGIIADCASAFVTDAASPVFGSPVTGGGSTPVPVYTVDGGTTWYVG